LSTVGAIERAAAALIAERGYHGASMRELARAVDLQMASLYHHFGSKQELLVAIMREAMAELTETVSGAMDAAGDDPAARLAAGIRAHVRFHTEGRPEVLVADSELRSLEEPGRAEIIALRDRHQALFREAIDRLGTDEPGIVTSAVITMCTDVALWYRSDGRLDPEAIAERYVRFALAGIAAP
jgi:AcrR family transcriptional regulator